ncbi:protein starmaker [Culex quinquefasciatus]|uniref:protein starmaker n=1 Tax=Culex quinquefasciatus TaxID=7176 RepID=UPI0018E35F82|nr:protein starmaker [Culex quinquefasciatus]
MVIKVYISGMSGSKEVKKRQQRVSMILDSKHIPYTIIDITEPGQEGEKDFMQKNSEHNGSTISDPTPRHPLPPQLFNDADYCGDYDDFDLANEIDNLEVFLKLEAPKPAVSDEVSPADEQQKNGQNEPEDGGDQVTATEEDDDENKENKTEEGANETTVDETIVEATVDEEKVEQSVASSVDAGQQDRTEDVAMEDETDQNPTVPAELEGQAVDQASCDPNPDGDIADEVPPKDTVEEVELNGPDSEDSQQKLEQTAEIAEEPLEKIDEDQDESSQQKREEPLEKDEESVEKIEEDHHDEDSEEVVSAERTDEDEAEKLEGAKDPPEESSPQEDIVDHEIEEASEDSESGDDDDEEINSIKEVLKDDADQVVVDEEDGLVEEMLERGPGSEDAVEEKANFSTTDADEESEDAEQRELLEAAAAMGKREDETEETAVGGAQAEEEEDVEIAEQEDDVSGKLVDTDDPMLAEQEQEE